MSILTSNYEISVWEDVLINGVFVERKVIVIGSDTMNYQGKAIEPQFTKRANGEKKFSFKMYKQYTDNITGEKVINPFCDYLISERKVKLKYENKWYDFVIKNISENSVTHLYSYSLEDALVQELSKNGFDVAFDVEIGNNLGTAQELGETALENTDWTIESEHFTERVEESLVYARVMKPFQAQHIFETKDGIQRTELATIPIGAEVLVFYSSCKNKPQRFQFIYLPRVDYGSYDREKVTVDENNIITVKDCQYYRDMFKISEYKTSGQYFLPEELSVINRSSSDFEDAYDTTVSNWYRGKRFGYAQRTQYVPLLESYCNLYHKTINGQIEYDNDKPVIYYGYVGSEYTSPALTENVITNAEFKGNTGWTGTYLGGTINSKATYGAVVKSTYGRFVGTIFQTAEDALKSGQFESDKFSAYLSLKFPQGGITDAKNMPYVINSGFYDNRSLIVNVSPNEKWVFELEAYNKEGVRFTDSQFLNAFDVELYEIDYNVTSGGHDKGDKWGAVTIEQDKMVLTIDSNIEPNLSEKEYQKREIKLTITPKNTLNEIIYIKHISLYKLVKNKNGQIIAPGTVEMDGVVTTIYNFVKKLEADNCFTKEDLKITKINLNDLDYSVYVPIYNVGAEKTRNITIKESNYFNILQTIAETFEAWLEIIAERNDELNPGRITAKKIRFKKYLGNDNYAAFRYGVNLKDIQRTYESKAIASKLIVKQNNNKLGRNGFCTIARAGNNPTGDNVIYDFRYFHNTGMMNAQDYVAHLYYEKNPYTGIEAQGKDINPEATETNAQNYFNRIKNINTTIYNIGDQLSGVSLDLTKIEAEKTVQQGLKEAAEEGIGRVREEFFTLTTRYPDQLASNPYSKIEVVKDENFLGDIKKLNPRWASFDIDSTNITANIEQMGPANSLEWYCDIWLDLDEEANVPSTTFYIEPRFQFYQNNEAVGAPQPHKIALELKPGVWHGMANFDIGEIDTSNGTLSKLLSEYVEYTKQYEESVKQLQGTPTKRGLVFAAETKKIELDALTEQLKLYKDIKNALNLAFYSRYYRFIQEGTWMSEDYVDDDKYYNDALSVLYNSCFPKVAYTINVLALSSLPGYEDFQFELGDKTYAEDPDFFGTEGRIEVVITEQTFLLDDPSRTTVKVQNFKNQFQDLFQKITATVQQAQYNSGSYEKAAELVNANDKIKGKFVGDALSSMGGKLAVAGQTTVVQDQNGITLTDSATKDEMRLIGGAILMSSADPDTGERSWKTGLTPEGISASLITAGTLNAGQILIMNVDEPVFRWDAFGLTAFDVDWGVNNISGATNPYKFVRYDKYGLYGINQNVVGDGSVKPDIDGRSWKPTSQDEIDDYATFALTWEGLKVTGEGGVVARIGKQQFSTTENGVQVIKDAIMRVSDKDGENTFIITNDGDVMVSGTISANDGDIGGWKITADSIESIKDGFGSLYLYSAKKDDGDKEGNWIASKNNQGDITFAVSKTGQLIARGVDIQGTIKANNGNIGDLRIDEEGMSGWDSYYEGEESVKWWQMRKDSLALYKVGTISASINFGYFDDKAELEEDSEKIVVSLGMVQRDSDLFELTSDIDAQFSFQKGLSIFGQVDFIDNVTCGDLSVTNLSISNLIGLESLQSDEAIISSLKTSSSNTTGWFITSVKIGTYSYKGLVWGWYDGSYHQYCIVKDTIYYRTATYESELSFTEDTWTSSKTIKDAWGI